MRILDLSRTKWAAFDIKGLRSYHYVYSGESYFQPVVDGDDEELQRDWVTLRNEWRHLESTARPIYSGHTPDPRNTDNAWWTTTVWHYHLQENDQDGQISPEGTLLGKRLSEVLPGEVRDSQGSARGVRTCRLIWLEIDRLTERRYATLYGEHRKYVELVKKRLMPHENCMRVECMRVESSISDSMMPASSVSAFAPTKVPTREVSIVPRDKVSWYVPYPSYQPLDADAIFSRLDVGKEIRVYQVRGVGRSSRRTDCSPSPRHS